MQREFADARSRIANLLADLEHANAQIARFDERERIARQLREVTATLSSTSTDVQSKSATIALLESQLVQLREERAAMLARHAEESQRQLVQMDQLKLAAQQKAIRGDGIKASKGVVEELQGTIASKTEEVHAIFKQLNERLTLARQEADKRVEEMEVLKRQRGRIEEETQM